MESTAEIIDISSDEDKAVDFRTPGKIRAQNGGKSKGGNDLRPGTLLDVSDDDDCLILDKVPDSVTAGLDYADLEGEMLDEMLIIGEKGQFACRDYPHPRYLCATFLFSITPHRKHCDMCHCYVCDCLAPCIYWESHCNSTHQEASWRVERQLSRRRRREQQFLNHPFDVKPPFSSSNRPILKLEPSLLSPHKKTNLAHHHSPIQQYQVKPAPTSLNRSDCKPSPSPLLNEPSQHTETTICSETLPHLTETDVAGPQDILCEIYKICPTVISCRRIIPPSSLQPDELPDIDLDLRQEEVIAIMHSQYGIIFQINLKMADNFVGLWIATVKIVIIEIRSSLQLTEQVLVLEGLEDFQTLLPYLFTA